jgi:hypothetical protein
VGHAVCVRACTCALLTRLARSGFASWGADERSDLYRAKQMLFATEAQLKARRRAPFSLTAPAALSQLTPRVLPAASTWPLRCTTRTRR